MSTSKERPHVATSLPAEDRRVATIRILLSLVDVDPTVSGATLILLDGSVTYLDAEQLRRGGSA